MSGRVWLVVALVLLCAATPALGGSAVAFTVNVAGWMPAAAPGKPGKAEATSKPRGARVCSPCAATRSATGVAP